MYAKALQEGKEMKCTVLKKGESLGDLAARLSAPDTALTLDQRLAALEQANPGLRGSAVKAVKADTLVFVPGVVGVATPTAADQKSVPESLFDSVATRIQEAMRSVAAAHEREEQLADGAVTRLKSAGFRKLAKRQPELKDRAVDLKARAADRLHRAKTARATESAVFAEITKDLAILRPALLKRSGVATALSDFHAPDPVARGPAGRVKSPAGTAKGGSAGKSGPGATRDVGERKAAARTASTKKTATKTTPRKKATTKKATTKKAKPKKAKPNQSRTRSASRKRKP